MQAFLYPVIRRKTQAGCLPALFALFALSSALVLHTSPTRAETSVKSILVLGDSISAAYGMSLEQGWVAQMTSELQADYPDIAVVNASISGENTQGALRRLPDLLANHTPVVVVIELGGNDGLRGYPLSALRDNLGKLVTLSQESGAQVILVPMEIPPNYGSRYTSGFRESFTTIAEQSGALLTPFILDGVAVDPALMQPDGIHPTAAAQPLLLANMLPTIRSALATP